MCIYREPNSQRPDSCRLDGRRNSIIGAGIGPMIAPQRAVRVTRPV
jgi:hypothetical protein